MKAPFYFQFMQGHAGLLLNMRLFIDRKLCRDIYLKQK